ncbi:MAG: hypothetical protein C3F06_13370 [Candidatus Methanoperedenaceae archaeon]|nr:MAG: hypothetical protein C3F06_13370 [Candidatus Methanoperedenaceae archaeon]
MKSNIKNKSGYIICIILLIFMFTPTGQALVSAQRTIDRNVLTPGSETNVNIIMQNDNIKRSLSIRESIPPGWGLIRISDDADQFKANTNEWVWVNIENNTVKTVEYRLTVPSGTTPGIYNINGNITTGGVTLDVAKSTIEVTSSPGSGSSSGSNYPAITPTPMKNNINISGTPTETITVTIAKQTIAAPIETAKETPIPATTNKSPGFGIMISIGIIATIYILRKMK